jgi:hypothetical protein
MFAVVTDLRKQVFQWLVLLKLRLVTLPQAS